MTRRVSPESCLEDLRSDDPKSRSAALDALSRNRVPYRVEIEARLIELLDDSSVVEDREAAIRTRDATISALATWPHTKTVPAIQARIEARGRSRSETLLRALGALAPESTEVLLAYADDADARVRAVARDALRSAVRRSRLEGRLAILERALAGLTRDADADDWSGFFTAEGPDRFAVLAWDLVHGVERARIDAWLESPIAAVREVAICGLARQARDREARTALAERIGARLPDAGRGTLARGADGRRRMTEPEVAVYALAMWLPDALAAMSRERPELDAALREYVVRELARPPEADERGEVWRVAHVLARSRLGEDAVFEALIRRLEGSPAAATPATLDLVAERSGASSARREELLARAMRALPRSGAGIEDVRAMARLASAAPEPFVAEVTRRLERSEEGSAHSDAALVALTHALTACGLAAGRALPLVRREGASRAASTVLARAVSELERGLTGKAQAREHSLAGLRDPDAARCIAAIDDLASGRVAVDDEIVAALLDALDHPGVHTFRTRDWDDIDDEFGRRFVMRQRRVAEEAVRILGHGSRRERSVPMIEARVDARGEEASESLYRALGELGPQSVGRLLRDVEHPSERVRGWARGALAQAIHWSTPAQRFAILGRAIEGLTILSEADDWLRLLEHAHGAFSPQGAPALRAHVLAADPDHDTVLAWLASEVRSVRAVALSVLAHRALDPSVRALLARRIAAELPRQPREQTERDPMGHRRQTLVELVIHILAVAVPEALAAIRANDEAARTALRDYALFELRRPDSEAHDGGPWFVALALAKRLTDDPDVVDALRTRTEAASRT